MKAFNARLKQLIIQGGLKAHRKSCASNCPVSLGELQTTAAREIQTASTCLLTYKSGNADGAAVIALCIIASG